MEERHYFCDKCKQQVKDPNDLKTISFGFGNFNSYGNSSRVVAHYDLCVSCREKLGLIQRVIKNDEIIEQEVSDLKDKLYDVMSQLVQEFGYQGEQL